MDKWDKQEKQGLNSEWAKFFEELNAILDRIQKDVNELKELKKDEHKSQD